MKKVISIVSALALALLVRGEVTTGWQSPLTSTTYQWEDVANWVDDDINGIFSEELVGHGKTFPVVTFTGNTVLPHGLTLSYTNSDQNLVFCGDSVDRTLTLGGDVTISLGGNTTKGSIVFGSATDGSNLNFDLEGDTVFRFENFGASFYGTIAGGDLTVTGSPANNANLVLAGNRGSIAVGKKLTLTTGRGFNYADSGERRSCRQSLGLEKVLSGGV